MRLFPSRLPDTQMKHERVWKSEYENTDGAAVSLQVMAFQRWLMPQFSPLPTRLPVWIMLNHAAGEDKTERIIVEFKCMETESCFAVARPQMCVSVCADVKHFALVGIWQTTFTDIAEGILLSPSASPGWWMERVPRRLPGWRKLNMLTGIKQAASPAHDCGGGSVTLRSQGKSF